MRFCLLLGGCIGSTEEDEEQQMGNRKWKLSRSAEGSSFTFANAVLRVSQITDKIRARITDQKRGQDCGHGPIPARGQKISGPEERGQY